ncbi:MAG: TIGR03936 family radical SAM-associated protein [Anaerolineales bacterium]|nr:TIGR03936 family radical SAM-associated protein [Anaerolineales bacterium]
MRIQLLFAKTEAMRYTGHLDLMRALERNFRRAQLPLAYTQGFNPRPRIVLASPLPLGVTSEGELAEVWLKEPIPEDDLLSGLNDKAPPGLVYFEVTPVSDGIPKLPTRLAAASYQARLEQVPPDLADRIDIFLDADSLPRERKGKPYDLRPLVEDLALINKNGSGESIVLMRLTARPGATGRPDEVLDALALNPQPAGLHRTRLFLDEAR